MALSSEERAALAQLTSDISTTAVELYAALHRAQAADTTRFNSTQAFELTKVLMVYAVDGVDYERFKAAYEAET